MKKPIVLPLMALCLAMLAGCMEQDEIIPTPTPKAEKPNVVVTNQQLPQEHYIEVSGYGAEIAEPDYATLTIGVSGAAETAEEASTICEENRKALTAAAIRIGVIQSRIRSAGITITGQADEEGVVTGYLAEDIVTIQVRDIVNVNTITSSIVDNSMGELKSVTYALTDASAAYRNALIAAMEDAHTKAETLAQTGGVTLGDVVGVVEMPSDDSKLIGVAFDTADISVPAGVTVRYIIH